MPAAAWGHSGSGVYYAYNAVPGCDAGSTADASGKCVPNPPGASQEDKDAASAAAEAAAKDYGFDDTAAAAAGAAAAEALDDWLAAGKPMAEAQAAAAGAAHHAAAENVTDRFSGDLATARSTASACIAAGNAGCSSAFDSYNAKLLGAGFNPSDPPMLCYGACGLNDVGDFTTYTADPWGDWRVVSSDGRTYTDGGRVSSIPYDPLATGATAYNGAAPSASQIAVTDTGNYAGTRTIVQTADGGGALVVTGNNGVTEVYYFDDVTHEQVAVATVTANGGTICVGDCANRSPTNDVISAGSPLGVGGASGSNVSVATLGSQAQTSLDQLTEALSGGDTSAMDAEKTIFEGALDEVETQITGLVGEAAPDTGWDWVPSFPSYVCEVWLIPRGSFGGHVSIDPCPFAAKVQDVMSYVLYFLTIIGLFNILTNHRETV